jgi:Predicted outer membrane protein
MTFAKLLLPLIATAMFSAPALAANPTDGEIAEIMKTANEGEIDAAKVAEKHASSPEVKGYAKEMVEAHKQNEKDGKEAFKAGKISPKNNDVAKAMKKDTKAKIKALKEHKKDTAEFDRAYIDSQVAMHQQLLNDLDSNLIPNAKSEDLKSYLTKTREHVQEHLTKAQQIQSSITK